MFNVPNCLFSGTHCWLFFTVSCTLLYWEPWPPANINSNHLFSIYMHVHHSKFPFPTTVFLGGILLGSFGTRWHTTAGIATPPSRHWLIAWRCVSCQDGKESNHDKYIRINIWNNMWKIDGTWVIHLYIFGTKHLYSSWSNDVLIDTFQETKTALKWFALAQKVA